MQLSVRTYPPEVREKTLAAIRRVIRGEAISAGAPREPDVITGGNATAGSVVYNDPALTMRLAKALEAGLGEKTVVEMPAKMTSGRLRRILDERQRPVRAAAYRRSERGEV